MQTKSAVRRQPSLLQQSFVLDADNLSKRVVTGASFKFLGMGLRTVITIGSTAILARMLEPADFGYIAMAAVVTEFAALFVNLGFTDVLIQRRVISRLQLDTVFWISQAIGMTLSLSVLVFSFAAEWLFGDPQVGPLLRVLCITFLFNSLIAVPNVVISRTLRFRTEFWIQTSTVLVRAVVAVAFAYLGGGVWSLVAGSVASSLTAFLLYFAAVPYLPRLKFQPSYLLATWKTSSFYFGGGLVYYLNMSIDLILVGRVLGATSLGFYQNARSLTDEIRARLAAPLAQILFPAFSALQVEQSNLLQLFMRSGRLLATVIFLLGFSVSVIAPELVALLYGQKWLEMIPLVALFGVSAAFRGSTALISPILNASNRVGLVLKYHIVGTAVMVVGIVVALPYGIEAVAAAAAIASLYLLVPYYAAIRILGMSLRHMYQIIGPPAIAATVMWLCITLLRPLVEAQFPYASVRIVIIAAIGFSFYLLMLMAISRQHVKDASDLVRKLLAKV